MTKLKNSFKVFFIFMFSSVVLHSQNDCNLYLGFSAGYSNNSLTTSVGYRPFMAYESQGSFTVGLPVLYNVNDWFGLYAEPGVIQKNYKWTRTDFYPVVDEPTPYHKVANTYLHLPAAGRFSFGPSNIRGFLMLGGYMGYWMSSNISGVTLERDEYDTSFDFDSRRDNRFEYGLLPGIGVEYKLNDFCSIMLDGRYYYSVSDLQKNYMERKVPRYNNTFTLQAGILFNFSHLFKSN